MRSKGKVKGKKISFEGVTNHNYVKTIPSGQEGIHYKKIVRGYEDKMQRFNALM